MFDSVIWLSNAVLWVEKRVIAALAAAITVLILLNIITRASYVALFWVDELAIYTMVWMVLVGASVMVRERTGIAANLVVNRLGASAKRVCQWAVDWLILGFSVSLLLLCWRWYDPPGLVAADFKLQRFAAQTFNFIYEEPTTTLGISKYLVWLIVPLVSVNLTLHSVANLLENCRAVACPPLRHGQNRAVRESPLRSRGADAGGAS